MERKKADFLVVVILLLLGALAWWLFDLKPLIGFIVYLLIPSAFLFLREKKNYQKIGIAVVVFGAVFGFFFDLIETLSGAWVVSRLVFPIKILGVVPLDDLLGFMLMTLFMVTFYEHFLDKEGKKLSPYLSKILFLSTIAVVGTVIVFYLDPGRLMISDAYLKGGIAAIVFPILFGLRNPKMIGKLAVLTIFFFPVWLLCELVAVHTGGWTYPGQYLGWVSVTGINFPIEELLFWMLCYAGTIVAFYERFVDDGR